MKKSIYLIENLINHKKYVGQSNDPYRRFKEHCYNKNNYTSLIGLAIHKWGKENFSFRILESDIENYNDREKYWISYYDCISPNGYNLTEGGECPPVIKGENNINTTHTIEQVELAKKMLKDTDMSKEDIAKQCGYLDKSSIDRINTGIIWRDDNIQYPIRKDKMGKSMCKQRWEEIVFLLQNTKLSQKDIAKKCNVKRSCVTMINNGCNGSQYNDGSIDYPIRKGRHYSINL